jgi:serpin B
MRGTFVSVLMATVLHAAGSDIPAGLNAFATESYKQLAGNDSNLILSPFNIATALCMTVAGARGRTAEEMQSVMHLRYGPGFDAEFGALVADLAKAGNAGGNELHMANSLWLQKGFEVQHGFKQTLSTNYGADPTQVDFIGDAENARSLINAWTEEHTKSKIKDLFAAGSLDARTRLVLASAIYFYGAWQQPFLTSSTRPGSFTLLTGAPKQTSFMNRTSRFEYTDTPSMQILEMRYAETGMAFDILLPKTATGLSDLEKSLSSESLSVWFGKLSNRTVQVSVPKFRVEAGFSLAPALSAMGMPTAFTSKADFTGINSKGGLAISQVVHKAFVDVSERGTEAAAATGVAISLTAIRIPEQPVVFRADHPFIFLIRDTRTGVILFIGRLTNPSA